MWYVKIYGFMPDRQYSTHFKTKKNVNYWNSIFKSVKLTGKRVTEKMQILQKSVQNVFF